MSIVNSIIILADHFNGNDTVIYNGWVMNGCRLFNVIDEEKVAEVLCKHDVGKDAWQEVLDAIKTGTGTAVKDKDYSRLLAEFAYRYCKDISDDKDVRQVILDTEQAFYALSYCRDVLIDADMRQMLFNLNDPKWAYRYCCYVDKSDKQMREIILNSDDLKWAVEYCKWIDDDADMRQAVLNSTTPKWAYRYCRDVSNTDPLINQLACEHA